MTNSKRWQIADYQRDALLVAQSLLGQFLVYRNSNDKMTVRIVETEAYRGPSDLACHARFGLTKRTKSLLGPAGHAYVYLIYGMYNCLNVVCGDEERGHAVLIRAVEPISGFSTPTRTDGPGRLTRAMNITRALDGISLLQKNLFINRGASPKEIKQTARVGIGYAGQYAEQPWRFFDANSHHVSRPSPRQLGLSKL